MNIEEYIKSGILEMYVLGKTSEEENIIISELSNKHLEIKNEIDEITSSFIAYSEASIGALNPTIKPFLMAVIDYKERLKNGEIPTFPPLLTKNSKSSDYLFWTEKKELMIPEKNSDIHAKIIGYTDRDLTAIVWIKDSTPLEVHTNQHEKFLILEGTCNIIINNNIHSLIPGDFISIPLFEEHTVKVSSDFPCKIILQRSAA